MNQAQSKGIASIALKVTRANGDVEDLGVVSRTELTRLQFENLMNRLRSKIDIQDE